MTWPRSQGELVAQLGLGPRTPESVPSSVSHTPNSFRPQFVSGCLGYGTIDIGHGTVLCVRGCLEASLPTGCQ